MQKLVIILVNYRKPDLTIRCLASLEPELRAIGRSSVTVVENGSGDDSAARLREAVEDRGWSAWVTLIEETENHGFAGGSRRGVAGSPPSEYVLLLNNDSEVTEGCLRHCLSVMDRDDTIGMMSCGLFEGDGQPQTVARRFPTPAREIASSLGLPWRFPRLFAWADVEDPEWDRTRESRDVDWVGGAFMLMGRRTIESVGMLDDDFFFYGEDVELCHRVRSAGYRIFYDSSVSLTHIGGGSSGGEVLRDSRRRYLARTAKYLVQEKCYGSLWSGLVRSTDCLVAFVRLAACSLGGRWNAPKADEAREVLLFRAPPRRRASR